MLLAKLRMLGVCGVSGDLIKSFLSNRDQYVIVNNHKSNILNVTVGVPQGLVLMLLSFNLFINDISNVAGVKLVLFVDDAVFFLDDLYFHNVICKLNNFLKYLLSWLSNNKILVYENKNKLMLFTLKFYPILPDIMFNGVVLEWTGHIRYLGVILDNKLSFDCHISFMCQKLNKARGALNELSSNLSCESMVTIDYSLAYSHVVQFDTMGRSIEYKD